ncbi:MAG: hypothetical protein AB9836_11220 [Aminipila sp.]
MRKKVIFIVIISAIIITIVVCFFIPKDKIGSITAVAYIQEKYKVGKTQETYKYYIVTTIGGSPGTKYTVQIQDPNVWNLIIEEKEYFMNIEQEDKNTYFLTEIKDLEQPEKENKV